MTDQNQYWNGSAGDYWVKEQANRDAMLRQFGAIALHAARVAEGERVLDVGCGCADTTIALAERVGEAGKVVGLDISAPMLARARDRCAGLPNVSFLEGDATVVPLAPGSFDLLYSRFGVMFFTDPVAAFRHLQGALAPRGRLAFISWRTFKENPWAAVPFLAAAEIVGRPEPDPPGSPGPFSFGEADRVRGILLSAGFQAIDIQPFDTIVPAGVTSGTLAEAAKEVARAGPVTRLLMDKSEEQVAKALEVIEARIAQYRSPLGGVRLRAGCWVVTARAPG